MAQILDRPVNRYIAKPDDDSRADYVARLAGDWTCFYVEIEQNKPPRLSQSELRIRQSGGQVVGAFVNTAIKNHVMVVSFKAEVINNVVSGRSVHRGDEALSGMGTFCCLAKRHNGWLEGYFSFVYQSGDSIENTRFIAVRHKIPNFDRYILEAKTIAGREVSMFRIKKLLEAGYEIDDAIVMLAALGTDTNPATL